MKTRNPYSVIIILAAFFLSGCVTVGNDKENTTNPVVVKPAEATVDVLPSDVALTYFNELLAKDTGKVPSLFSNALNEKLVSDIKGVASSKDADLEVDLMLIGLTPDDLKLKDEELVKKHISFTVNSYRAQLTSGCEEHKGSDCCKLKLTAKTFIDNILKNDASVVVVVSNGNTALLAMVLEDGKWKIDKAHRIDSILAPLPESSEPCKGCSG